MKPWHVLLIALAVAVGVFVGEYVWWHYAAMVAHDQLCRSLPGYPGC